MEDPSRRPQFAGLQPLLERLRGRVEQVIAAPPTAALRAGAGPAGGGEIGLSLENFETLLQESFPPCMRHLVMHQRAGRRLRFLGRLQLRPFLWKAGLAPPGGLQWWETELRRDLEVTHEIFDRKHRCQVLRAYGARGHGVEAHPFGRARIQDFPAPRAGQLRGCPFSARARGPVRLG
ncbi:unnamed protein product [Prorocentrum cordatum]|uniref:DNA primase large subunit C-terminal domain-containing protein n=1 Tax=Prorocentrum cordatum TaxID=2364126 RepID=A0ABN9R6H1_9DINO|nr:unnamed protein product [Polarella glacialis]